MGGKKNRERRRITVHSNIYGADARIAPHCTRISTCDEREGACWQTEAVNAFGGWRKRAVHHCLRRNKNGVDVEGKRGFLLLVCCCHERKKGALGAWDVSGSLSVCILADVRWTWSGSCMWRWWCSTEVINPPLLLVFLVFGGALNCFGLSDLCKYDESRSPCLFFCFQSMFVFIIIIFYMAAAAAGHVAVHTPSFMRCHRIHMTWAEGKLTDLTSFTGGRFHFISNFWFLLIRDETNSCYYDLSNFSVSSRRVTTLWKIHHSFPECFTSSSGSQAVGRGHTGEGRLKWGTPEKVWAQVL